MATVADLDARICETAARLRVLRARAHETGPRDPHPDNLERCPEIMAIRAAQDQLDALYAHKRRELNRALDWPEMVWPDIEPGTFVEDLTRIRETKLIERTKRGERIHPATGYKTKQGLVNRLLFGSK